MFAMSQGRLIGFNTKKAYHIDYTEVITYNLP